jgi:hypothetical protein
MCAEKHNPTPAEMSHRLVEQSLAALDAGVPGEAVSHFEQALGFQHGNPDACYYLARALNVAGSTVLARRTLALARTGCRLFFTPMAVAGPIRQSTLVAPTSQMLTAKCGAAIC